MALEVIHIHGAKGGVGCSTIALSLAILLSESGMNGNRVTLTVQDIRMGGIMVGKQVAKGSQSIEMSDTLTMVEPGPERADKYVTGRKFFIIDHESILNASTAETELRLNLPGTHYIVIQPCYLSLAGWRKILDWGGLPVETIMMDLPGRALGRKEIETVVGPLAGYVAEDAAIPRVLDCGIITQRMPESLRRGLGGIVQKFARTI